jgi:D-alanine-D-alanine ligase
MRIGLAFDLKEAVKGSISSEAQPEDALEEYDSTDTVGAIAAAIEGQGHSTVPLGGGRDFLRNVQRERPDLVFNIAEGLGNYRGREAQVPAILEMLDIPFTGSDPLAMAVSLDKAVTKSLVTVAGVKTPGWRVIDSVSQLKRTDWAGLSFPVFIKPLHEGSSKGIRTGSKIDTAEHVTEAIEKLVELYHQPVMVEEFIYGDEITTGIVGNAPPQVIGIMRVVPRQPDPNFVYSLEVKRDWERLVDYECPARLDADVLAKISASALAVFAALGCRDVSRVDFRISHGTPYFLEINPLPGLNPRSGDIVIMAKKMGWTYPGLISAIVDAAVQRYRHESPSSHHL